MDNPPPGANRTSIDSTPDGGRSWSSSLSLGELAQLAKIERLEQANARLERELRQLRSALATAESEVGSLRRSQAAVDSVLEQERAFRMDLQEELAESRAALARQQSDPLRADQWENPATLIRAELVPANQAESADSESLSNGSQGVRRHGG